MADPNSTGNRGGIHPTGHGNGQGTFQSTDGDMKFTFCIMTIQLQRASDRHWYFHIPNMVFYYTLKLFGFINRQIFVIETGLILDPCDPLSRIIGMIATGNL